MATQSPIADDEQTTRLEKMFDPIRLPPLGEDEESPIVGLHLEVDTPGSGYRNITVRKGDVIKRENAEHPYYVVLDIVAQQEVIAYNPGSRRYTVFSHDGLAEVFEYSDATYYEQVIDATEAEA